MSKTYYIFRHGLTHAVKHKTLYWGSIYSAPILDEGKPAIERLAHYLATQDIDHARTSQFLRCRQTADIVSNVLLQNFCTDRRLGEFVLESPWHFSSRVSALVSELKSLPYHRIAICTHALVIEMLLHHLTKRPFVLLRGVRSPAPGVLITVDGTQVMQKDFSHPVSL